MFVVFDDIDNLALHLHSQYFICGEVDKLLISEYWRTLKSKQILFPANICSDSSSFDGNYQILI